ncbi:MAG: HlyD family efflux transporter periplasmic adaptor subunit [Propionibacteriaceae bacterium]
MTWINRLRLFGGLLGITLLVAALTLLFNQRQSEATSLSAQVEADQYKVGATYSGTVTKAYVAEGDSVTKGQKLFTVQSVDLQQDISNGLSVDDTEAYNVDIKKATLTYKAVTAGVVTDLKAKIGASLSSGSDLATLTSSGSEYVVAQYLLTPNDYGRIEKGAPVKLLLPDNKTVAGQVDSVKVQTDAGQAATEVRVNSEAIRTDPSIAELSQPGTPVTATLTLRDDGPLAGASDLTFNFLRQIGLR